MLARMKNLKAGSKQCAMYESLASFFQPMTTPNRVTVKSGTKLNKLAFEENEKCISEIPHQHLYSKADFCNLTLPSIRKPTKYAPLGYRDPYARPSTTKKNQLQKKFVNVEQSDPFKLPRLPDKRTGMIGQKKLPPPKPKKMKKEENQHVTQRQVTNDSSFRVGSTVHFIYSDYMDTNQEKIREAED